MSRLARFRESTNSYTAYSIGCAVAWAILWIFTGASASRATQRSTLLVFCGWWIGWTSETIARAVYPPPKLRKRLGTESTEA